MWNGWAVGQGEPCPSLFGSRRPRGSEPVGLVGVADVHAMGFSAREGGVLDADQVVGDLGGGREATYRPCSGPGAARS